MIEILLAYTYGFEMNCPERRSGGMSYLVVETHRIHAVFLDNEGRFLKVANLGYDVGQTHFICGWFMAALFPNHRNCANANQSGCSNDRQPWNLRLKLIFRFRVRMAKRIRSTCHRLAMMMTTTNPNNMLVTPGFNLI